MKELHHDNYPSQSEMQEWLEANREIYTDFKSKIQSILKNLLCDNYSKQIDDETNKLQSIILEIMTTEEGVTTDELIDKFSNAIKDGNVSACCLYCYLELDNGGKATRLFQRELKTVSKRIEAEERFPEEQKAKLSLYNFIT